MPRRPLKPLPVERGEHLTVDIVDAAFEGLGIARLDNFVLMTPQTLPGDRAEVEVLTLHKRYAECRLVRIERPAPDRVEAPCPHVTVCGSCPWQHWAYGSQLAAKANQIRELVARLGGQRIETPIIHASPNEFRYRNKMELTAFIADDGALRLGMHARGDYRRCFAVEHCQIAPATMAPLMSKVELALASSGLAVWDDLTREGVLRHAIHRTSTSGETMLLVSVIGQPSPAIAQTLSRALAPLRTETSTGVISWLPRASTSIGEDETILWGSGKLHERILHLDLEVGANSFVQTNPPVAEMLYSTMLDWLDAREDDVVADLYAGVGTIALLIADRVRQVYGAEIVPQAVTCARANAKANDIENVGFELADVKDAVYRWGRAGVRPDLIIADPPRAGLNQKVARRVAAMRAPRILYLSCNPATFARDLAELGESGYAVERLEAFDMFPQTYHVELIAELVRRKRVYTAAVPVSDAD